MAETSYKPVQNLWLTASYYDTLFTSCCVVLMLPQKKAFITAVCRVTQNLNLKSMTQRPTDKILLL